MTATWSRVSSHPIFFTLLVVGVYLWLVPPVPDLAAQFTRANLARTSGFAIWWSGWFGGMHLPTYSEIAPLLMGALGAPVVGALATLASVAEFHWLVRLSSRPRAASATFALAALLNLLDGRVTFCVGAALGLAAIVLFQQQRNVLAAIAGVLTCLGSPLAGLFVGLAMVGVFLASGERRKHATWVAGTVAVTAVALAVLFPGAGFMSAPAWHVLPAAGACFVIALLPMPRVVRAGAFVLGVTSLATLVLPSAVGENITRETWLLAAPLLVGYLPMRRSIVAGLAVLAVAWPIIDVTQQLVYSQDPSAYAAFYQPLLSEMTTLTSSSNFGSRIEVLDPRTHGADRFVSTQLPLARGWDRQADQADNPLFYRGLLNDSTYQQWLGALAVSWVAVPTAKLDRASQAEAVLVASDPSYLQLAWSSANWKVYRVLNAAPLVQGAKLLAVSPTGLTMQVSQPGLVKVSLRWSPYLRAVDIAHPTITTCVTRVGAWTEMTATEAGLYSLQSAFDIASLRKPAACRSI